MMRRLLSIALVLAAAVAPLGARDTYQRQPGIAIQHYVFALTLSDSTDAITGEAQVTIRFVKDGLTTFFFDLASESNGKGMTVTAVLSDDKPVTFSHARNHLNISLPRPTKAGEWHRFTIHYHGVPADGLGAGLVQVRDQKERGVAYRYFVEQAAALPGFVGAGWFIGVDESVTGRMDGENYNIGFVDGTDRAYPELVSAAKETLKRLQRVHSGTLPPFNQRPMASDAGTQDTPWKDEAHGYKFNLK